MVEPYKQGLISEWGIKKFNLDDLYVRFFRLAERRIAEKTGKGIICYVSNYSYLSDPSFVVMRQRLLQEFDAIWIDSLNGDSRETGKLTPDGKPDPSVFSTEYNREGIRLGTAIGLLARREERRVTPQVHFRQFWGVNKRAEVLASLQAEDFNGQYEAAAPNGTNRYSLRPSEVATHYQSWPLLTELASTLPLQGMDEDRAFDLIDTDKEKLERRLSAYFDIDLDWESLKDVTPGLTRDSARYEAKEARKRLLESESFAVARIVHYDLKPFDKRWCYYTGVRPIWKEPRPALWAQVQRKNLFVVSRPAGIASPEGVPLLVTRGLLARDALRGHAIAFPVTLYPYKAKKVVAEQETFLNQNSEATGNLSLQARAYIEALGIRASDDQELSETIWMHALAIGYSPQYLQENADGIRQDWPRVPLPTSREALLASAELGRQVAALLDTETPVPGVTVAPLRAELRGLGEIARVGGGSLRPEDGELDVTAGWGHGGKGGVTMPGRGRAVERDYTAEERQALPADFAARLGERTRDIYLNDAAYWRNVPERVWSYTIGGYQVMKKWLSYRELPLLGRSLKLEEVREVTNMARRIAAILLLEGELDANYVRSKEAAYEWRRD